MNPSVAVYLRDRDLHTVEGLLAQLTSPGPYLCKRVVRNAVEVLMPQLETWCPLVPEEEVRRLTESRLAGLPIDEELSPPSDRERFRDFLREFAAMSSETPTILRPGFWENLPTLRKKFPALTLAEMRSMAEAAFEPDTEFVLAEGADEPCPRIPLDPELEDRLEGTPRPRPGVSEALRKYLPR